jgi:hypothetical protein
MIDLAHAIYPAFNGIFLDIGGFFFPALNSSPISSNSF